MYANTNRYEKKERDSSLLILGETSFRHAHRRFGMYQQDRLRHTYVLGKTGAGKSTFLSHLLAQDLAQGTGLAILDPHGSLATEALAFVPAHRINDVLLFAPADQDFPVSFNVLRAGRQPHPNPGLLTSQLISVFKKHWADSWGPRLEHILRNAILAIAQDCRATLLFLYRFLTEETLRETVVEKLSDPVVKLFWTREFPGYGKFQAEALAPVLNKLGAFVAGPLVRNIIGQERNRVDLAAIMNNRGVLLANLATGTVGADSSHLLGSLLLSSIQLAAMSRPRGSPSFIVYVDEFQNFVTDSLATMLAESRKFGVGLVLAHQYLAQLPMKLQEAVLGNVGSLVLFRLGATDALVLAPEMQGVFSSQDLQELPRHEVAMKLLVHGTQLPPFSARTLPMAEPPKNATHRAATIEAQSRLRYSTSREHVEKAIRRSLGKSQSPH